MVRPNEHTLTFEKGLLLDEEDSVQGIGYARDLENWEPSIFGGLRIRRGWSNGSVAGGIPATRQVRGIGTVATQDTYATPEVRQSVEAGTDDEVVVQHTPEWPQATVSGSLLLATVLAKAQPQTSRTADDDGAQTTDTRDPLVVAPSWPSATGSGSLLLAAVVSYIPVGTIAVTPPGGWTARESLEVGSAAIHTFEIANAAPRSGSESFSIDTTGAEETKRSAKVFILEIEGIQTASPFDKTAETSGTSSTASSGTTAALAQADEYALAIIVNSSGDAVTSQSNPTGGFTNILGGVLAQSGHVVLNTGVYEARPESTTGVGCSVTLSTSKDWIGLVVTYKNVTTAPVISAPAGWSEVLTNTNGPTSVGLYHIVGAASRSGGENFVSDRFCRMQVMMFEYPGVLNQDGLILAGATGTSTAPAVSDATSTSPAVGQKVLVVGLVGVGTKAIAQSAPTDDMVLVRDTPSLSFYAKVITATAAQDYAVTLASSQPWAALLTAYESSQTASAGGFHLVAHDDGTNFDIWAINRNALSSAAWSLIDGNVAWQGAITPDRTKPVAFASGLGVIMYTHPDFLKTRQWNGTAASDVTNGAIGRCIAFYRNRFFVGGTKTGNFGNGGTASTSSVLWWSDLGSATVWNVSNFLQVGQDDGEPIEDIRPVSNGLLIAKKTSLWLLTGTGPDNFELVALDGGTGYVGRCITVAGPGAVIVGQNHVWVWSGGLVQLVSKPVHDHYDLAGSYVTTCVLDEQVFIADAGSSVLWVYDLARQIWWKETLDQPIGAVFNWGENALLGPYSSTAMSLLMQREHTGENRLRDEVLAETFVMETPEYWFAEASRTLTNVHVYFQIRQHDGNAAMPGLTVTPYKNGVADTVQTIAPKASARRFRARLDFGGGGLQSFKLRITQELSTSQTSLMDIERMEVQFDVSEAWP